MTWNPTHVYFSGPRIELGTLGNLLLGISWYRGTGSAGEPTRCVALHLLLFAVLLEKGA